MNAVNDAPSIDIASTIQVAENQTAVTTVSVSDVDEDELTLTLGGTDADSFNLSDENVLTFKEAPDYETKSSYVITLSLTDGTETVTKDVTITITNVNDVAPVFTSDATFSAAENQTAIGTVTATDAEGGGIAYSISGSEILVNASSGVLTFVSAPDYETKTTYTVTATASDGVNSTTQDITVNITNINEVPSFTSSATFSAAENQTTIGSVSVTDPENATLSYSLSGTDASSLAISSSGVLSFGPPPNYESKNSYSATVAASDGTNSTTQDITINITDVNEIPYLSQGSNFYINENEASIDIGSAVIDEDGDTITFSVASGSPFDISSSGVLTLKTGQNFDYESQSTYFYQIGISDGSLSQFPIISIYVKDLNDSPSITSSATFSAAENQTAIGSISASDDDGDSLTYSISGSEINISSSGVLTFASAPDYETQNSYTSTVTVSDGTASVSQSVTVTVTDVNEAPTITSSSTFTIAENQTSIGSVTATDPENQTLTYAIYSLPAPLAGEQYVGGGINSSTGAITLGGTGFNYEERTSITAQVEVSDGTNAVTQDITINITDLPQSTVTQLGSTLTHSAPVTFEALALSGNGLTLVHGKNTNGVGRDSVEILKFHLGSWTQLGSSIEAEAGEIGFGNSVAISNDGTIVAIGITKPEGGGIVRVYKYSSDSWSQLGSDIISADTAAGDYFGYATSLSNDGTILAVGATDMGSDNNGPGAASVYQYSSGSWTQLGSTINGIDANDWFGRSVSLSGNGQIVAIGSDRHDSSKGQVRIYEYVSGSWSQLGSDIDGNSGDRLGRAVSLSDDGSIIALGSNFEGTTKVFQFASGSWSQLGGNMTSSYVNFVTSATISDDGTIVTFGGPGDSVDNPGSFATYKYSSNTWTNIVSVTSTNAQDLFGWATSTSNDGSIVAVGDYDVNGASSNSLAKIAKIEIEN